MTLQRRDLCTRRLLRPDTGLAGALAETLQSAFKVRGAVRLVPPGSLPNDGKVIADERPGRLTADLPEEPA